MSEELIPIEKLIGERLLAEGLVLGTAESCTGGSIAASITSVAGSSAYFSGGIVSYSNQVKHEVLGVSVFDLVQYGAVSRPVVEQMAMGAIRILGCDCSVATSGIAGPDGGTVEKPVGTVWIAAAVKKEIKSECFYFEGDRLQIIKQSANTALRILLEMI